MSDRRSALERGLSLITQVEPGEGASAVWMTVDVFVLLLSYYVIKPVREALILELEGGARYKSYLGAVIAVALLFAVPAYARATRYADKSKLVVRVSLFFASHLAAFFALAQVSAVRPYLGPLFFVWVGIFNMMVVAQFWAFAADLYEEAVGKRLFALFGLGAAAGAAAGGGVSKQLIPLLGVYPMLLVAAALLAFSAWLARRGEATSPPRAAARAPAPVESAGSASSPEGEGAFALVWSSGYLRAIAAFAVVFSCVNSNSEFILSSLVTAEAASRVAAGTLAADAQGGFIGAFYGDFFFIVNVLGLVLQLFVTSRLVDRTGLRGTFMVMPVVATLDGVLAAFVPQLAVWRHGKALENAVDYSINNTARNILWLPTTKEMKYRAKQAIDTFFVRLGDVSSAALVALAAVYGAGAQAFGALNASLGVVWLALAWMIVRMNERLARGGGA
jgi:AAA family ATP:ADP antiporter